MAPWRFASIAALCVATLGAPAQAADAAPVRVEAVQYPAWLERGGREVPLTPGVQLQSSDRLRTGANARVQLKLSEGSSVKLGENARFVVERVQDRGIFRSTMQVVLGAFRFTTGALGIGRKRDIEIKVRTVTAGIRGTDLWGKSTDARDLVCLLEGRISVASEGSPQVTLASPRDFYQRPRDGAPQVGKVDAKQIEEWSRETEIQADGPAAGVAGRWRVIASKFVRREDALALRRDLRARGYPAEVNSTGKDVHHVEIGGLAGEPQARALMAGLREVPGVSIPSVVEGPATRR
jgi:cell division septation protein DedD